MLDSKIATEKKTKLKEDEEETRQKQLREINLERKLELRKNI